MPDGARDPAWAEWSPQAFARALTEARPVALYLETRWSPPCARFRRDVLSDPDVTQCPASRFVPIAVDADLRPDLAERYTSEGWPTFVALTPHGWPLAPLPTSGAPACARALAAVADAFDARRDALLRSVPAPPPPAGWSDPHDLDPLAIVTAWLDDWEASGGERRASATPQALLAAIDRAARARRDDLLDRGVGLLDRLAASALRDADSGLWFRAAPADEAGWEPVQTLDDQAAWIAVEAAASALRPSTGRTARLTASVRGIARAFALQRGYRAARFVHGPADDATRRGFDESCDFDDRLFVDAQARLAAALMRAGVSAQATAWIAGAIDRLDDVVSAAYRRDGGVAHVLAPEPRGRGLLGDQVAVAAALLDAWEVSGRSAYLDAADELMQSTMRKFADPASGALRDRIPTTAGAGDVGLLGQALQPPDANAVAASTLVRIGAFREDPGHREAAHDFVSAAVSLADPADPMHPALLTLLA